MKMFCKYTINPVYVDSSNVLTFGAIDETYARKTEFDSKADAIHSHEISDITNIQDSLDSKAASSHTHTISNVTNLQTSLDSKSDTGHHHKISSLTDYKSELLDLIYPIGSVYIAMSTTNPADLFGRTWEQIKDRFLLAAGQEIADEIGFTEGTTYLEERHLPQHTHIFTGVATTDSVQFRNTTNGNVVELKAKTGIYSLEGNSGSTSYYGISTEEYSNTWDVLTWTYTPEGTISEGDNCKNRPFFPPFLTPETNRLFFPTG